MEEVNVVSDDHLTDRKPFCMEGYLAACRGDDVSTGVQKGHFSSAVCNSGQLPAYAATTNPVLTYDVYTEY